MVFSEGMKPQLGKIDEAPQCAQLTAASMHKAAIEVTGKPA